jgi:hypothetical protein
MIREGDQHREREPRSGDHAERPQVDALPDRKDEAGRQVCAER